MVGAFRWPTWPLMPIETGRPSVKACLGSWQLLQATVPSADKRRSKNSFWPRAIFLWNPHPRADRFAVLLADHPSGFAGKLASSLAASDLGGGTLAALRAGVCGHGDGLAVQFISWLAGLVLPPDTAANAGFRK